MTTDRPTYPPRSRMLPSASRHPFSLLGLLARSHPPPRPPSASLNVLGNPPCGQQPSHPSQGLSVSFPICGPLRGMHGYLDFKSGHFVPRSAAIYVTRL